MKRKINSPKDFWVFFKFKNLKIIKYTSTRRWLMLDVQASISIDSNYELCRYKNEVFL